MLFNSLTFLFVFLPLLILVYFCVKNIKVRNIILFVFSILFYSWGEPIYIFLMLLITFVVYIFGLFIHKYEQNNFKKKTALIICILFIVFTLFYFKYVNFFITNINLVLKINISYVDVVLPIGISFYSFQILSYIIDLYRKKVEVQKNYLSLALYFSFFPQLIAGPIVRYSDFEKQLNNRSINFDSFVFGFRRFIFGLSKKIIMANQFVIIADLVFNNLDCNFGSLMIWFGVISYTLQIYFDFSGYSDMAIGLGKMFGFTFNENFNYPYSSKSITDFWRRWHVSLSSWFKDYIYIPLGGNRVSLIKWIRNMLVVWLLTGFWHGASWIFVVWGLYFCILLVLERLILNKILNKLPVIFRWLYTIFLVMIGWVIFRVNSLNDALYILKIMFVYKNTNWVYIFSNYGFSFSLIVSVIPFIIFVFPIFDKIQHKYKDSLIYTIILNLIVILLFLICVMFLTNDGYNPFIYFRF